MNKKETQIIESSGNVFADLGFERHEAENLLVRARLMAAIKAYIESEGITQREAAERFNVAPAPHQRNLPGKDRVIFCRQVD